MGLIRDYSAEIVIILCVLMLCGMGWGCITMHDVAQEQKECLKNLANPVSAQDIRDLTKAIDRFDVQTFTTETAGLDARVNDVTGQLTTLNTVTIPQNVGQISTLISEVKSEVNEVKNNVDARISVIEGKIDNLTKSIDAMNVKLDNITKIIKKRK